jgi:hypothetical protein
LTEDNDFGDLIVRLRFPTHGVIRVSLKSLDRTAQNNRFLNALAELGDKCVGALVWRRALVDRWCGKARVN